MNNKNKEITTSKKRTLLILGVVLFIIAFVSIFSSSSKENVEELEGGNISGGENKSQVKVIPGLNKDKNFVELQKEKNQIDYEKAKNEGESFLPTITAKEDEEEGFPDDIFKVEEKPVEPEPEPVIEEPEPVIEEPVIEPEPQPEPVVETPNYVYKEEVKKEDSNNKRIENYQAKLENLTRIWSDENTISRPMIEFDARALASLNSNNSNRGFNGNSANSQTSQTGGSSEVVNDSSDDIIVGAGTVIPAVLLTAINTDEPGPVLAEISSGPLQGARVIGAVTNAPVDIADPTQKVTIKFSKIRMPGSKTFNINAYAVDPATSTTALVSSVDHHLFKRYGLGLAAAFVEGLGNGFEKAINSEQIQVNGSGTLQTIATKQTFDNKNILLSSLGTVGRKLSSDINKISNVPTTIKVDSGIGVGLFFISDF